MDLPTKFTYGTHTTSFWLLRACIDNYIQLYINVNVPKVYVKPQLYTEPVFLKNHLIFLTLNSYERGGGVDIQ